MDQNYDVLDQSINRTDQPEAFFRHVKESIDHYRANVIEKKYADNLAELEKLLENLRTQTNAFIKEQKGVLNEDVQKRIESEIKEAMDYINLIASEMENFIREDKTLSDDSADYLLVQNNYIKNLSLRDELRRQLNYYENASKQVLKNFKRADRSEQDYQERFADCFNAVGKRKFILKEFEGQYKKLTDMMKNVDLLVLQDMKALEQLQNVRSSQLPPIVLDIIGTNEKYLRLSRFSYDEMVQGAENCLNYIHSLEKMSGKKQKYRFAYGKKLYDVMVPRAKFLLFLDTVKSLKALEELIKIKERNQEGISSKKDRYEEIEIDYGILKEMNMQQKGRYFRSIMTSIESKKSKSMVSVSDAQGQEREIPAYYYRIYQDCYRNLELIVMSMDEEYVNSLNDSEKITYCDQLMERIENSNKTPKTLVDGKEIPAIYSTSFMKARNLKEDLVKKSGLFIDPEFVNSLSYDFKKAYYQDLIMRISKSAETPKIVYEVMGEKLNIPTNYVALVRECEAKIKELDLNKAFAIDSFPIKSNEKFRLYQREIRKIQNSKLEPKISVTIDGENYEIPEVYQKAFSHCFMKIQDLLKDKNTSKESIFKKIKIKKIRKPRFLEKFKNLLKDKSKKVQLVSSLVVGMASGVVFGFATGAIHNFVTNIPVPNKNVVEDWNQANNPIDFAKQSDLKTDSFSESKTAKLFDFDMNDISFEQSSDVTSFTYDDKNDSVSVTQSKETQENSRSGEPVIVADRLVMPEDNVVYEDNKISEDQVQEEQNPFLDEWTVNAQQTMASELGGTFVLNGSNEVFENPYSEDAKNINAMYQNSVFTTVGVSIKMPDGSLKIISYVDENAKEKINEYLSQGGIVERVSAVAEEAEANFEMTHFVTGCFDVNKVKFGSHVTDLSEKIGNYMDQGKGVSR